MVPFVLVLGVVGREELPLVGKGCIAAIVLEEEDGGSMDGGSMDTLTEVAFWRFFRGFLRGTSPGTLLLLWLLLLPLLPPLLLPLPLLLLLPPLLLLMCVLEVAVEVYSLCSFSLFSITDPDPMVG